MWSQLKLYSRYEEGKSWDLPFTCYTDYSYIIVVLKDTQYIPNTIYNMWGGRGSATNELVVLAALNRKQGKTIHEAQGNKQSSSMILALVPASNFCPA